MSAQAQIIPFRFEAREVRTLLIGDQPWFVATDVAASLGYPAAPQMTRWVDDDEKGMQIVHTPGGEQEMLVINESGLYSAILRSRKAEAKRFKKWVTSEVLPSIRRHGFFKDAGKMGTLISQTIGTDGFHVLGALVAGKVRSIPAPARRRATMKLWAQVHAAYNVRSAEDIPADQLDSARQFIAAYVLEGELLDAPEPDTLNETIARLTRQVEAPNGVPAAVFMPLVDAVLRKQGKNLVALPPGRIPVDARKLAAIWIDLGKLRARVDGLGILESDLPPAWWAERTVS